MRFIEYQVLYQLAVVLDMIDTKAIAAKVNRVGAIDAGT